MCLMCLHTAERHIYSPSEGKEAFLQLAKLCGDPNLVGIKLLDSIPNIPLSELGCSELHQFVIFNNNLII